MVVDTDRVRRNVENIKSKLHAKLMLMVKANAYGHGLLQVAGATQDLVDAFGVATIEEAKALQDSGVTKDILVLLAQPNELCDVFKRGFLLSLHCKEQLQELLRLARVGFVDPKSARLHLKVDSGMHRFGFEMCKIDEICRTLKDYGFHAEGVFSHLRDGSASQKALFDECVEIVKCSFPNVIAHLASSHSFEKDGLQYDMVRVGLCAYKGAMSVISEVVDARFVRRGEIVGYGGSPLENDTNVAFVFGGYADGICRESPHGAWIGGKYCKAVGIACMDVFAVDTQDYIAKIGEKVTLFDGETALVAANERKTVEYCVYTAFSRSRSVCKKI